MAKVVLHVDHYQHAVTPVARCSNDRVIFTSPSRRVFDEPGIIEFLDEAIVDERPRSAVRALGLSLPRNSSSVVTPLKET
jgi:hypothetical protein